MTSDKLSTAEPSKDPLAEVRANIERFLDKHTREGGIAFQHNMAARPAKWRVIDPPSQDEAPRQA
jgi:hypothetical protein